MGKLGNWYSTYDKAKLQSQSLSETCLYSSGLKTSLLVAIRQSNKQVFISPSTQRTQHAQQTKLRTFVSAPILAPEKRTTSATF